MFVGTDGYQWLMMVQLLMDDPAVNEPPAVEPQLVIYHRGVVSICSRDATSQRAGRVIYQ